MGLNTGLVVVGKIGDNLRMDAITSFALSGDEQRAKDARASAYLAKPCSPFDLLTMLRKLVPEA